MIFLISALGFLLKTTNAQTDSTITTSTVRTTTVTYPSVSLNCDFEKDFCAWSDYDDSFTFKWNRNKGNTLTDLTGPLNDHTTQSLSGSYAYIQVKKNKNVYLKI